MSAGFVEFEFDLPEALLAGVTSKLTEMAGASLVHANLADIPEAQGVYMLLYRGDVACIGKDRCGSGPPQKVGAPCMDNPTSPKSFG
jgi:hypothetical protein